MRKSGAIFLSYCRKDDKRAIRLERALSSLRLRVWRDLRNIRAGERWPDAIERGIREARGVVVLVTAASAGSDWVTYEYAFATGAEVPVIAVVAQGGTAPRPVQQFQVVWDTNVKTVAQKIDEGILAQSRTIGQMRASAPKLVAKFQEENGEVCHASSGKVPSLWMDLWVEHAPRRTRSVSFEILDVGFRDRKWTVRRDKRASREFLTEDMNSYGDVEIWAHGATGTETWSTTSRLYEALVRYYRGRPATAQIRRALRQIRET
jgi:hypothetical protein